MTRVPLTEIGVDKPRFRLWDLGREALLSIAGHPVRSLLTAIGTVLGAAAFVATLGLSATLSQQVSSTFDLRRATEVTVLPPHNAAPSNDPAQRGVTPPWQTMSAMDRLRRLNGIEATGQRVMLPEIRVARAARETDTGLRVQLMGLDSGALGVLQPHITLGRTFDSFHDRERAPVVLLAASTARNLGIDRIGVAVFIGGRPFTVMGIFDDVQHRPEALLSVVIPFDAAAPLVENTSGQITRDVLIKTGPGAAQMIGGQAPLALSPQDPTALQAITPPDPKTLRREVEGSITRLSLILSIVALAIGSVSIGNAAAALITARTGEIGLRRAVGAKPRHIFTQLLGETTLLGALGGLTGALTGVAITVSVALWNSWQPVIDLPTALLASTGGAAAGLIAGLIPAWRATRIQPVAALQR